MFFKSNDKNKVYYVKSTRRKSLHYLFFLLLFVIVPCFKYIKTIDSEDNLIKYNYDIIKNRFITITEAKEKPEHEGKNKKAVIEKNTVKHMSSGKMENVQQQETAKTDEAQRATINAINNNTGKKTEKPKGSENSLKYANTIKKEKADNTSTLAEGQTRDSNTKRLETNVTTAVNTGQDSASSNNAKEQNQRNAVENAGKKNVIIQFFAGSDCNNVQKIVAAAQKSGINTAFMVQGKDKNGNPIWKARVAAANNEEGKRIISRLRVIGFSSFIVKSI